MLSDLSQRSPYAQVYLCELFYIDHNLRVPVYPLAAVAALDERFAEFHCA